MTGVFLCSKHGNYFIEILEVTEKVKEERIDFKGAKTYNRSNHEHMGNRRIV